MKHSTSSPEVNKKNIMKAHPSASRVKAAGARLLAILFWLGVWQVGSVAIGQELLLVSPITAIRTLFTLMGDAEFYLSILNSLLRILGGFALGVALGALLAVFSYMCSPIATLLSPLMYAIKATPVASFVILALIFISSRYLSVLMAFLMVLPMIYTNVLTGLRNTDRKLLEMAKVFRMKPGARIRAIYLHAVYPHFLSACALSLGMSWKAGIAAEVIGLPDQSIGEALYQAKIFFSTPELFAWTLMIIMLSVGLEQAVMWVVRLVKRRLEGGRAE